jgi:hypothetical protein
VLGQRLVADIGGADNVEWRIVRGDTRLAIDVTQTFTASPR